MEQERLDIGAMGSRVLANADIRGDVNSEKDVRLDGRIEGNVKCAASVLVNKEGKITGNVDCRELYLNGKIKGNVRVEGKAVLGADAVVTGFLMTASLEITPGAKIGLGLKLKNASK